MFDLDGFHELVLLETGLTIYDEGQDESAPPMPYIGMNGIDEKKYRPHQILKESFETSGEPGTLYLNPSETIVQYGVVYESGQAPEARDMIRKLYNYLCTDRFKAAMKRLDGLSLSIVSNVRETKINRGEFFERRFTFDVKFFWQDQYSEVQSDTIDAVEDVTLEAPPEGL